MHKLRYFLNNCVYKSYIKNTYIILYTQLFKKIVYNCVYNIVYITNHAY